MSICALAVSGAYLITVPSSYGQIPGPQNSPVTEILQSRWLHRRDDSPPNDQGMPLWIYEDTPGPEWQPMTGGSHLLSNLQGRRFLWLMIQAPEGNWKHPALLIPPVSQSLEVYQNHRLIYRSGELEDSYSNRYWIIRSHLVPLENLGLGSGSNTIFLRIYSDSRHIGIQTDKMWLGSMTGIIKTAVKRDIESFAIGLLLGLVGLFSIFVYLRRRKQKHYIVLSFGAFAICIGIGNLAGSSVAQLSAGAVGVRYYLTVISAVLWPIGLYIFVEHVLGRGYKSLIRRIWQVHILFAAVGILLDVIGVLPLPSLIPLFFGLLMVGIFIVMPITLKVAHSRGNLEARVLAQGMGIMMLSGMHDILAEFGVLPYRYSLFTWGILVFVLLLAYILEYRFAQAHRQLEEYSLTLEHKVEDRTQELSEKNETLEQTLEQLRTTQRQLIMQEKMASLGNLVAGVAHEMNNPIGVINSAADTTSRGIRKIKSLLQDEQDEEQLYQSFDLLEKNSGIITMASDRVANIVRSLKAFARLDEALFQEVNIHQNIDTTLTLLSHELREKADVIKEYGEIPRIQCYPNELNQAFMNVLRNAAQAIEERGTITVSTCADESLVHIRIADTGRGIPPEDRPQVFNPGFTTQSDGVGKGLGLSIVYNVVQKHHGDIEVDSEVGKGTEITIALPIKQPRDEGQ